MNTTNPLSVWTSYRMSHLLIVIGSLSFSFILGIINEQHGFLNLVIRILGSICTLPPTMVVHIGTISTNLKKAQIVTKKVSHHQIKFVACHLLPKRSIICVASPFPLAYSLDVSQYYALLQHLLDSLSDVWPHHMYMGCICCSKQIFPMLQLLSDTHKICPIIGHHLHNVLQTNLQNNCVHEALYVVCITNVVGCINRFIKHHPSITINKKVNAHSCGPKPTSTCQCNTMVVPLLV